MENIKKIIKRTKWPEAQEYMWNVNIIVVRVSECQLLSEYCEDVNLQRFRNTSFADISFHRLKCFLVWSLKTNLWLVKQKINISIDFLITSRASLADIGFFEEKGDCKFNFISFSYFSLLISQCCCFFFLKSCLLKFIRAVEYW